MGEIHALPTRRGPANQAIGQAVVHTPGAACPEPCNNCTARSLTICAPLTMDEQLRMADLATTACLRPHQVLFGEGDTAEHVYSITSGSLSLSKSMADGRRQITGFLGPGDFVGLNTREAYTVSAETLTETHVCRFPRLAFRKLMATMPALEHKLLALAESELATAQEQILLLGRKTAMERIASFLLLQSERCRARGMAANPIPLPMTRAEVADYLGLTIETVSRCFTKLRKLEVIGLLAADRVEIKQPDRLRHLAEAA
jgi:CRP/FNR family transcriptional regulator